MAELAQYKEKLLNDFEARTDEWRFSDFERALKELRSTSNYQDAKFVIKDGYEIGRWPNTVKRYLLTNYQAFGCAIGGFENIIGEIFASLSEEEKKYWRLPL